MDDLGTRIRRLRKARGLSQEDLARAVEAGRLTAGAVGQFERGAGYPLPETLERLAHALGVEPDYFVEWRLARARRLLDERAVGLGEASHNMALVESLLLSHEVDAAEVLRDFESTAAEGEKERFADGEAALGHESRRGARAPRRRRSA